MCTSSGLFKGMMGCGGGGGGQWDRGRVLENKRSGEVLVSSINGILNVHLFKNE